MKKIITHKHVDIDNVSSVISYCINNNISVDEIKDVLSFVDADYDVKHDEETILCDVKGNKHPDGLSHFSSYFSNMYDGDVVQHISDLDSTGKTKVVIPMAKIIGGLHAMNYSDVEIIQYMMPIFKGLHTIHNNAVVASQKLIESGLNIFKYEVDNGKVYYVRLVDNKSNKVPAAREVLLKLGVTFDIYYDIDKGSIGIYRYPEGDVKVNLYDMKEYFSALFHRYCDAEEEFKLWFFHPNGFLSCVGSEKCDNKGKTSLTYTNMLYALEELISKAHDYEDVWFTKVEVINKDGILSFKEEKVK